MEGTALYDLHEAVERRRELEYQLTFATLDSDQAEIKQEIRNVNRRIKKLQGNVHGTYPEAFVDCRDIGHAWSEVSKEFDDNDILLRTLACQRCNCFRYDRIASTGQLAGRRYHHEDGYLLVNLGTKMQKEFWRGLTYMTARG